MYMYWTYCSVRCFKSPATVLPTLFSGNGGAERQWAARGENSRNGRTYTWRDPNFVSQTTV